MLDNKPTLKFNKDGHFKILMVSDFHCGRNSKLPEDYNYKLKAGLEALVKETEPDFVMVGGDQVIEADSVEGVRDIMSDLMEPVLRRNIPWSAIFGNHDNECGIPCSEEEKAYQLIPGNMNELSPEEVDGSGNYCINIYSSDSSRIEYNIFALDSHREASDFIEQFNLPEDTRIVLPDHFNEGSGNASPTFEQAMWYYNTSKKIEKENGRKIPAVMFMHIPLQEFLHVTRNPEETDAIGNKRECLGCCELNFGVFGACLQRGDVKGIFFGHEHLVDIQGEYCGITMAQDAALGYNMSCHDDLRGGRVIDLYEDGTLQTYAVKLIDLMGLDAMRRKDYFEGGCKYYIRKL